MRKPLLALALFLITLPALAQNHVFRTQGDHFTLDGKPFQVISGELHYARIPREYWHARLKMARAMGLNTIATYVFWNIHEPTPGHFDFSGNNDLAAFIKAAQEEGLYVLLRAGPYSCAEWEFGGFPAWLLKDPRMAQALRSNDPAFMLPAEHWITRLAQETTPLLLAHGGPILAVQVENEYGNFGNEPGYMQHMLQIFQSTGWKDTTLYTVDPSKALARGSLPGILSGVNFGTGRAEPALAALAALRPGQPLFATEYWPGWFDLFGHPHETRPTPPQLQDIDYVLSHNGSINIYMFHGGTSFGTMAGASASTGNYRGNVTSYDYDAPLDESGHPTPKFFAYRDTILKYTHESPLPIPETAPIIAIPAFTLSTITPFDARLLPAPVVSDTPLPMEQVDQAYGYILYRTQLPAPVTAAPLVLDPVHDYAQVYLDGVLTGTLDRHYNQTTLPLTTTHPARLDILVENTGRLNSTRNMRNEWKGIHSATLAGQPLTHWQIFSMPMQSPPKLHPSPPETPDQGPHLATGLFTLTSVGDTFLDITALSKGLLWINGHPLGRFWNIGPQDTLYLPAPWLKKGRNEVVAFDLFPAKTAPTLIGRTRPILDGPPPPSATDPEHKKKADPNAEFGPKLAPPATPKTAPQAHKEQP
jgi:beta-galactosidase